MTRGRDSETAESRSRKQTAGRAGFAMGVSAERGALAGFSRRRARLTMNDPIAQNPNVVTQVRGAVSVGRGA